jgi:hypothetical protein
MYILGVGELQAERVVWLVKPMKDPASLDCCV